METKDQKTLDRFLSKLSDEYNLSFETAYEPTSFQYESDIETFAPSRTLEASTFVIFTLFYSLSLILWILENNRHIAIYRLNGLTSRKILKRLLLKELVILFLLNLLVAFFFVLHSVNHLFVLVQLFLLIFSLIISFFVIDLLGNLSLNKQLNRQTFGKGFFYTIYSVKMLILFFSVVQLVPLAEYARTFVTPEAVPEEIKIHAVFYPRLGGNEATLTDLSQDMRGLDKTKLLSQLLDDGAIEVDTSAYFEEENPLIHQSIYVNTNYLDKYPLISITNQPIQIDKNEDREIILIPERMMPDFVQLRSWFLNETNPDRRTKKEEDVLFYTIQDEQEIFAFDQEQAIIINQPNIIHVFTLNNLPISHRNILTGNSFAEPLKIPLIGTAQETYDRYLPLLKEARLEDNFPFLIPMEQLRKTELQLTYLWDIRQRITDLSITILLVIVLITYSTLSYFRLYRQKFVVWRLNGVSFFKTYRRIFLLFGLQYLLFFIYVAVHSFRITDVFIFSLYILIECIVLLSTFFLIEKKQNRLCESK
ncbi:hypothetical protein OKO_02422 [Enterococcus faecium EnGen0056]|uniref:DUF1430 domain-containing protein n=1 Tax=Enterococcus faecium TaxID=1352 RepID=UPI0002A26124|nr:DUF1430 domain-containing protein [Enterococcus faecium]ELB53875.1 hypothetical protein OKO_02422 [Enterococcus faecium EnGen0056]